MPRTVRGALLQASWTGDKESMIQKHEKYAHEAAKQGAQVMLFQELFYGPYFCQVQDPQYYSYTEHIPDGPTTKRMQDLARETRMVLVVPMYEEDEKASGIYYNTAAVIDADGSYLGKYRTRSPTATSLARSTGSGSNRWATTTSTARATSATRAGSSSATWDRPTTRS